MPETDHRPLPLTVEEITREWLTAALRTTVPGVEVRDFRIVDMIRTTCTKIRLKLDLNEEGRRAGIPETVILKGGFEPHSRQMGFMHEKEVRGYRDVLPVLGLPSPETYFADYDAGQQQGIVIMEDLVARGVEFCSALKPHRHEEAARRLSVLARFHAKTWGSQELESGGRWSDIEDHLITLREPYFDVYLEPETWAKFIPSPRGASSSVYFHDRDWMADALDRVTRFSGQLPHSLLHMDAHPGNLYVDYDGTPGFFDSLTSRGPAMLEVSYYISSALDTMDRARWEGSLIQHYLDEVRRNGVEAPAYDEALRQYGIFLAYAYFIWIINEPIFQTEATNTAFAARVSAAMIDHDTIGLLKTVI